MSNSDWCPQGWNIVKLRDLGEVNRGRSRHRPRYAVHLYDGQYPFIQTGDIKSSNGKITKYEQTYSEAGLAQSRLWPAGTMCITIAANIAETAILTFPACFPDSVAGFIPNNLKCDVRLVEYMFRYLKKRIQHEASGSVQDNINISTLDRLYFPIPPLPEQKAIAHILGTLDDKIELNQQMNQTLEAIAKAIFKSWFVDFDPVRAKMEGRQPVGMDAATAELFPDSFEESALGLIPRGWRVGKLGDIAINSCRSTKPENTASDTPYIGLEHMPRRSIALSDWGNAEDINSNKYEFHKGEILFGKLRPYFHKIGVAPLDGICSTDILVINCQLPEWFSFVLSTVSTDEFINYTDITSTGTRMPRTNWNDMSKYEISIPSTALAQVFNRSFSLLIEKIILNIFESRTLSTIRDTLLPKLMSGEIRVKEAQTMIEEAV
jgi:type I restriction enzyme S subunit